MAYVEPCVRRDDRGQLILITGLLVAVAFVIMTLLFNTAIYTDNLAARGTDIGGREAIEFQRTTIDGIGEMIDLENRREHQSQTSVESNVSTSVAAFADVRTRQGIKSATVTRLNDSALVQHEGALVRDLDGSLFNDSTGQANWTMATSIPDTRQFDLRVDRSSLTSTDAPNATSAFHVLVTENATTTDWRVFVYENAGDIVVAVKNDSASIDRICSVSQSTASIDLTAGTIAGKRCTGLVWANGIGGSYDVAYRNGDEVTGTYNLTLNTTPVAAVVNPLSLNDGTATTTSPYHVPAVYSATLPLHLEMGHVEYRRTVRIARGEPS